MDSAARLDYALFQLTPTRTRFDLVLFCERNGEKLASGLFEPFISHLKFAKDEISKGGYSISLRPPSHGAQWFTKATFERFVRFVSTPAVLERFVSLENEIVQIEISIQANELSNANAPGQMDQGSGLVLDGNIRKSSDSSKVKGEFDRDNDSVQEENSKIQFQRLLETRRALLRKEQAMAYARGLVAGFDMENIEDLISFADAYGASRLREACINFKELCKNKHGDGLWMEELAAMEACSPAELSFSGTSGIVLTNETIAPSPNVLLNFTKADVSGGNLGPNDSKSHSTTSSPSSEGKKGDNLTKGQVPMTWQTQLPSYMYNFQGPIHQLPPYQGYPFPSMHPHYAGNMQWPANMKESSLGLVQEANYHSNRKSKKEKFIHQKASEYSGEETQTESSDSDSGSDSGSNIEEDKKHSLSGHSYKKKHKKKSSKTVVIRNINYITPKSRNGSNESSSEEDEFIDEDSLKRKVDDAVGLLKKSHKAKSRDYHKKGDANKSLHIANGSNEASDQDFDDNSVADSPKRGKGNDNWDAFQNLLLREEEAKTLGPVEAQDEHLIMRNSEGGISSTIKPALDLEAEKIPRQQIIATDSFMVTKSEGASEIRVKLNGLENGENFRSFVKRGDCTDADLVFSQRSEESGSAFGDIVSTYAADSSTIKTARGEDWFVVNHSGKPETEKGTRAQTIFDGDYMLSVGDAETQKPRKDVLIDDSLMIQARPATDDLYDSQWKTDISMVVDLAPSPEDHAANGSQQKREAYEPDDLCMVLERESEFQSVNDSWSMDYGIDLSLEEANKRGSSPDDKKFSSNSEDTIVKNSAKGQGKEAKSKVQRAPIGRSKPELISKSRKPSLVSRPAVQKSKLEKEEEIRKRMEELLIQRQKRIAERTTASGLASPASKKAPLQSKTAKGPIKHDKNNTHSATRETNRIGSVKIRAS